METAMYFRISISVLTILFSSNILFSQGFYIKAGGGYRFGLPTQTIGGNSTYTSYNNPYSNPSQNYSISKYENLITSLGEGIGLEGAVGFRFDEYYGAELAVKYGFASKYEQTSTDTYTSFSPTLSQSTSYSNYKSTIEVEMFAINPSIVFTTHFGLYGRTGVFLAFPKATTGSTYQSTGFSSPDRSSETGTEITGNIALGFTGAIGIVIGSGPVKPYIESEFLNLDWGPERQDVNKYRENGVDKLALRDVADNSIIFVDSYSSDSRTSVPTEPLKIGQPYVPLSSWSIKAGILIELGGSGGEEKSSFDF